MELIIKALSAIGVVAIGVAGWMLQHQTTQSRQRSELRDRDSLKYLTTLRTLIDLEIDIQELRYGRISPERAKYSARALFLPDNQPNVSLSVPNLSTNTGDREPSTRHVVVPLRAAGIMLAELAEGCLMTLADPPPNRPAIVALERDGSGTYALVFEYAVGDPVPSNNRVALSPESSHIWKAWLRRRASANELCTFSNVVNEPGLVEQLRNLQHDIVAAHPNLGDRYLDIRNDTIRLRLSQRQSAR